MTDIDNLLKKADERHKIELTILHNASIQNAAKVQRDGSKKNLDDWAASKAALDECISRLQQIYLPKKAATTEREFKNQKEALQYLIEERGYKVSAGKFSQDSNKFTGVGKQILLSDLIKYAKDNLEKNNLSIDLEEQDLIKRKADTRKAVADADKSEIQASQMQRELDKEWIKREDSDVEVCAWTGLLRDTIDYKLEKALLEIIQVVGGDPDRLAEAKAIKDNAITAACNDISNSDEVSIDIDELEAAS